MSRQWRVNIIVLIWLVVVCSISVSFIAFKESFFTIERSVAVICCLYCAWYFRERLLGNDTVFLSFVGRETKPCVKVIEDVAAASLLIFMTARLLYGIT